MADTGIEWTRGDDGTPGKVWNCLRGCSLKSTGCSRNKKGQGVVVRHHTLAASQSFLV